MSRIITRVTRGRIRMGTSKDALVLAVAGALYFATEVSPPITPPIERENRYTSVTPGGGGPGRTIIFDLSEEEKKRIREEEDDLFLIGFLRAVTNIINDQ